MKWPGSVRGNEPATPLYTQTYGKNKHEAGGREEEQEGGNK